MLSFEGGSSRSYCVESWLWGYKWQEDEEEDVGSYWMTLRKGEDAVI